MYLIHNDFFYKPHHIFIKTAEAASKMVIASNFLGPEIAAYNGSLLAKKILFSYTDKVTNNVYCYSLELFRC